ncbi:hypothetical protein FQR65_LT20488 [Abscondita terminalis]|nr:hypothetical protein FQR65_LT20488 [Abscondita terminalis]
MNDRQKRPDNSGRPRRPAHGRDSFGGRDRDRDRDRDGGERRPYRGDRDRDGGERRPYRGDRQQQRDSRGRGGTRGGGRSDRGGADREYTEAERLQHSLRPVRSEHDDPIIPDHIEPKHLNPSARNELKTLQAEIQERVSRHLAMVAMLIDDDPELAHQHAISASRRAGRIPVVRETLAMTAYRTGDFALAIRELRTFRRLSGKDTHAAIMVDSERGLGRPQKAIETGLEVNRARLETVDRVRLAIAMSGARLDLGQTQQALFELEIPELDPNTAFVWSPELFGAYATVLEDLGRDQEAAVWFQHADRATQALEEHFGGLDELEVLEIYEHELPLEEHTARDSYDPPPIDGFELLLTDLDGVIYRGGGAIPGAIDALNRAAERARVGYITNNASRTDTVIAEHLAELGLRVTPDDVITSPQAAIDLLRELVPAGSRVFVVGGEGLTAELEKAGFEWTRSADDNPVAVVQGFAPDVGWKELAEAAYALQEEPGRDPLPWIATNTDWTTPQARGIAPGNGTLVSAVHTAVQRLPVFAGKPETPIYETAFARFASRNALMLGDRLDTDIRGAIAVGIPSLFVLTGVDRPKQLIAASTDMQPDYIVKAPRGLARA